MGLKLRSYSIASASVQSLVSFFTQVFDLENQQDSQGEYVQIDQQKIYLINSLQFSYPAFIELEIDEDLFEIKEKIEFYLYRHSEKPVFKIEKFSTEEGFILLSDFEQRSWLIFAQM